MESNVNFIDQNPLKKKSEKRKLTDTVIVAAVFLGVGALVIYFLIILPSQGSKSEFDETAETTELEDEEVTAADDLESEDEEASEEETIDEVSETAETTGTDENLPETAEGEIEETEPAEATATWSLAKTGAFVECDSEGDLATFRYTVTLTNTGSVSGDISEVVDSLETIVSEEMVSISQPAGVFSETTHQITWNGGGAGYTIGSGESQTFIYTVVYDDRLGQFGTRENDVTAEPSDGSSPPAAVEATVTVGCDIPDTGLQDGDFLLVTVVISGGLVILAISELNFGLVSLLLGEDRVDSLMLSIRKGDSKGIIEKRLLKKSKKK